MTITVEDRFRDHAKVILADAPLSNDVKGAAWDAFFDARTVDALASKLADMNIPESVASALLEAKRISLSDPNPRVEAVLESLRRMAAIDPAMLDLAERNPNVLRQMIETMQAGEK